MAHPGSPIFYIGLYRDMEIFLSETIRPRALTFGMQHHRVYLYQVCLKYAPGTKNDPATGVTRDMVSF